MSKKSFLIREFRVFRGWFLDQPRKTRKNTEKIAPKLMPVFSLAAFLDSLYMPIVTIVVASATIKYRTAFYSTVADAMQIALFAV